MYLESAIQCIELRVTRQLIARIIKPRLESIYDRVDDNTARRVDAALDRIQDALSELDQAVIDAELQASVEAINHD